MERLGPGSQRTEELNVRMAQRNTPSAPLQPQFGIRPLSTKYAMMPIFDRRPVPTVSIQTQPTYDVQTTFNPGTAQAPWCGFALNINAESQLRNQYFALQRGAGQGMYIPNKNSDMYEPHNFASTKSASGTQPFPDLFEKQEFTPFNPCPTGNGTNFFANYTRQQIKEIV